MSYIRTLDARLAPRRLSFKYEKPNAVLCAGIPSVIPPAAVSLALLTLWRRGMHTCDV